MTIQRDFRPGLCAALIALLAGGCSAAGDAHRSTAASEGIALSPDPAIASSRITITWADGWQAPEGSTFEWRRNGSRIVSASGGTLEPGMFARGDRIEVVATLPDSAGRPGRTLHAETRVVNSPPRVLRAGLALAAAAGGAEVRATAESADPDGDPPVYSYRWFRNGSLVAGENGAALAATNFARGDRVQVEVVASDGESPSAPLRSEPFALENHPPQFGSQPVPPGPADDVFRYQAAATDPDGDAVRYELVSGPMGMTVDAGGAVYWPLPPAAVRNGEYAVRLRASDGKGGEATQDFTLRLAPAVARN